MLILSICNKNKKILIVWCLCLIYAWFIFCYFFQVFIFFYLFLKFHFFFDQLCFFFCHHNVFALSCMSHTCSACILISIVSADSLFWCHLLIWKVCVWKRRNESCIALKYAENISDVILWIWNLIFEKLIKIINSDIIINVSYEFYKLKEKLDWAVFCKAILQNFLSIYS